MHTVDRRTPTVDTWDLGLVGVVAGHMERFLRSLGDQVCRVALKLDRSRQVGMRQVHTGLLEPYSLEERHRLAGAAEDNQQDILEHFRKEMLQVGHHDYRIRLEWLVVPAGMKTYRRRHKLDHPVDSHDQVDHILRWFLKGRQNQSPSCPQEVGHLEFCPGMVVVLHNPELEGSCHRYQVVWARRGLCLWIGNMLLILRSFLI